MRNEDIPYFLEFKKISKRMSVKAGQLYRHIRTNRLYKVLNIARNAATDDA